MSWFLTCLISHFMKSIFLWISLLICFIDISMLLFLYVIIDVIFNIFDKLLEIVLLFYIFALIDFKILKYIIFYEKHFSSYFIIFFMTSKFIFRCLFLCKKISVFLRLFLLLFYLMIYPLYFSYYSFILIIFFGDYKCFIIFYYCYYFAI